MEEEVKNFYEMEAGYASSVVEMKNLINKVISIDVDRLKEQITEYDAESKYAEFIDLFLAVIGRKTNKYYVCENMEEVKYYHLTMGNVYRIDRMNVKVDGISKEEKPLKLVARAKLAEELILMTEELKKIFLANKTQQNTNPAVTLNENIIKESDISFFDNLTEYLKNIIDTTGRLKILEAERDVYAYEKAKEDYNKKSSLMKWMYKTFNKEENVIDNMAKKNR